MKKDKSLKLQFGFTLIELLVIISLVGIIMMATVGLLLSILRGSRKSDALNTLKQNGNHVLEVMSSRIRNAKSMTCGGTTLTIINQDGRQTIYSCANGAISSNSANLVSTGASNCLFSCTVGGRGVPPNTSFQFTLTSSDTTIEGASSIFKATVSLRNY
ncbi:hypothetical protein A2160_06005 [Candidatus Beckwithbacteria bacterium RBG_13_42_9]|uniref:Type II secretion system protein n=1 Tax=Candidatus Beckwithbacteria bacterium RBG_13_42_9 TaxID=1797457 RepID=A0A1F5E5D4_9BACT|nr:MAG: hypothetical protein A2160_06005 [Candidatus Beckwithbacteria bacterium RBG_13_42_9]